MEASQSPPPPSGGHFAIGQDQLAVMSRDHDVSALQQFGGASLQLNYLFILFYFIISDFCIVSTWLSLVLYIICFPTFTSGQRTIRIVKNKFREGC